MTLSDDAKIVLGTQFNAWTEVGFWKPWNRSERAVKAFDELVSRGHLVDEGGYYRCIAKPDAYRAWVEAHPFKVRRFAMMKPTAEWRDAP